MARLLIAILMLLGNGAAFAAGYAKPVGVPTVFVPSHGVEVGVWAVQTPIGHGIGVFERSGNGDWNLCGQCMISPEYPTMDGPVAEVGGPGPYVASKLQAINEVLSRRYPSVTPEPTGSTMDRVNQSLSGYVIRIVNGSPALGPK